jgi:hypothetical protein
MEMKSAPMSRGLDRKAKEEDQSRQGRRRPDKTKHDKHNWKIEEHKHTEKCKLKSRRALAKPRPVC